jgi:hypothetical protein
MEAIYNNALSCTRWYYLKFHDALVRAMGREHYEPLYDGPPVPAYDAKHDEFVLAWRAKNK